MDDLEQQFTPSIAGMLDLQQKLIHAFQCEMIAHPRRLWIRAVQVWILMGLCHVLLMLRDSDGETEVVMWMEGDGDGTI